MDILNNRRKKGKERDRLYGHPRGEAEMARYEIVTWNQKGIRLQWLKKKKSQTLLKSDTYLY